MSLESPGGPLRAAEVGMFVHLGASTGRSAREVASVDLSQMLREVAAAAADEGAPRKVRVHVTAAETCVVHGNVLQLRSALEHVVHNAVFYTRDNTTVDVEVSDEKAAVVVCVRDRGPGVPQNALRAIFRPFFRVAEAGERDSGGAGLGLAIAAAAITAHGGSIDVGNNPDGGLFVTMRLPDMCREGVSERRWVMDGRLSTAAESAGRRPMENDMFRKQLIPRRSEGNALTRRATGEPLLEAWRREVEGRCDDAWGREPWEPLFDMGGDGLAPPAHRSDGSEDDGAVHVSAEWPGMVHKDVQVSLEQSVLSSRGEKKSGTEDQVRNDSRRECRSGACARSSALPPGVDAAIVTATVKNRPLESTLPKLKDAQAKGKRVPLTSA